MLRTLSAQVRKWTEGEGVSVSEAARLLQVDRRDLGYLIRFQGEGDRRPSGEVVRVIRGAIQN